MAEVIKQRQLTLEDYTRVLRRRWWMVAVPAVVLALAAYAVSWFIPNRFTSTTLLLVQQPRVPDDFVKSVVSEDLNSRLAIMKEQIMSRTRLQPLIDQLGLYKEEVGKVPMEELIERMRRDIQADRGGDAPARNHNLVHRRTCPAGAAGVHRDHFDVHL